MSRLSIHPTVTVPRIAGSFESSFSHSIVGSILSRLMLSTSAARSRSETDPSASRAGPGRFSHSTIRSRVPFDVLVCLRIVETG
jgi:hypothetical protein